MLEEVEVNNKDIIEAISALEDEINARILNGDGDIEALTRVCEALSAADRIVIK
jgi:hypothetical protein